MLFHDEPTEELDGVSRRTLLEYLQSVRATDQATHFMTTLELEEAYIYLFRSCDKGVA